MNVPAAELKPGMWVLQVMAASPSSWLELADPAIDWSSGGGWVTLCYADGTQSRPMPATYRIEVRTALDGRSP